MGWQITSLAALFMAFSSRKSDVKGEKCHPVGRLAGSTSEGEAERIGATHRTAGRNSAEAGGVYRPMGRAAGRVRR